MIGKRLRNETHESGEKKEKGWVEPLCIRPRLDKGRMENRIKRKEERVGEGSWLAVESFQWGWVAIESVEKKRGLKVMSCSHTGSMFFSR